MKQIKHPLNDKAQKLSKDMKKQELVKPKSDKKLDADKSLSDPTISKRVVKPSNKKLSSEKHLAGGRVKKVGESMTHLMTFNEMFDPMGDWKTTKTDDNIERLYSRLLSFFNENEIDLLDSEMDIRNMFMNTSEENISGNEKASKITSFIDDKLGLDERYLIIEDFIKDLFFEDENY